MSAALLAFSAGIMGFIAFGGAMGAEENHSNREGGVAFLILIGALVCAFFAGRYS